MRYFPQIVVPLLLFLIAILLGAILYLQYTRAPNETVADSGNSQGRYTPWDPIETPDFSDEDGDMAGGPEHGRRERDSGVVEVEPHVTQEPARVPPVNELKPDLQAIETAEAKAVREKADAKARLEAVLARGAVLEQEQGGEKLGARVLWIVPAHEYMGAVTSDDVQGHYCGPLGKHSIGKRLADTLEAIKDHPDNKDLLASLDRELLLVGRVVPDTESAAVDTAWRDLKRPPLVVEGLGRKSVANKQGWFALRFELGDWAKEYRAGLKVRAPGWKLATSDNKATDPSDMVYALDRDPYAHKLVTLAITPAAPVILQLTIKPTPALTLPLRVWLEIFDRPEAFRPYLTEPGLFIESNVPSGGVLSFVFPDPRTFCTAKPRFAACGDGWSSGTPRVLERWHDGKASKEDKPPRYLLVKQSLDLQPASTELVQGLCLTGFAKPELSPVRVESKQTGATTWSIAGAFGVWVELSRGNWQQKLIVDPLYTAAFEFSVDYDAERPSTITLAEGASAPLGPWQIKLPARNTFPCYLYVESDGELDSIRVELDGRGVYLKFKAVEDARCVYLVEEFPRQPRDMVIEVRHDKFAASTSLIKDTQQYLSEDLHMKDPWGNPYPMLAVKRK